MNPPALALGAVEETRVEALLDRLLPSPLLRTRVRDEIFLRAASQGSAGPTTYVDGVSLSSPRQGLHMLTVAPTAGREPSEDLRLLLEASRDVYVRLDPRGRILGVNAAIERLSGWHPDEVVGHAATRLVSLRSREALRCAIPALIDQGHLENLELEVRRASGEFATAIAHVGLVREGGGVPGGVVAVLRDITSRKILQERLLEADRLAATGKLAARVAHEINNPLQALAMHMSIVGPEISPDVEVVDSWERMRDAARQIQRIVSDLLDLREAPERDPGPADLNEAVRETVALARKSLAHRSIETHVDLDGGLPGVDAPHRQLRQIALNLVLHAMDSMRHGGQLIVRTRRQGGGTRVRLDVADTGPEIAPERLARLFDPHPRAGAGSDGLGLFVAHTLVRAARGRIAVDSSAGQGTRFSVHLPAGDPLPAVSNVGGTLP